MRHVGFSVFVKHRQRRLTLKRFLPSIDAAVSFVQELRRHRFHAQDAIFVVDESTGDTVPLPPDGPAAEISPAPPPPASSERRQSSAPVSFDAQTGITLASIEEALDETTAALHKLVRVRRELRSFAALLRRQAERDAAGMPDGGTQGEEAASPTAEAQRRNG